MQSPRPAPTKARECSRGERLAKIRQLQQQEIEKQLIAKTLKKSVSFHDSKPIGYQRPSYNTPTYWRDSARGWITETEQQQDHAEFEVRRKRGLRSVGTKAKPALRHSRPPPGKTKQFAKPMSTEAARDDRLTPQSKALLQIITARTGQGRSTDTTKTTLGAIMSRHARSIQRYIQELIKFGYIRTQTIKSRRTGYYIGLRIWIMDKVLPFYKETSEHYDPTLWHRFARNDGMSEETKESLTNNKNIIKRLLGADKPPWFDELAYK